MKSFFAQHTRALAGGLLSLCLLLGCLHLSADAGEMGMQKNTTNIVAVVDCSTSMQVSDFNWKVPESLYMLTDMCPSEDIRLSLVVYCTYAAIAFRDMPLSEENHSTVKQKIKEAIVDVGYTRGQTDTGAALGLARTILEEQAGQNNMVLLFTDGAVTATHNGRTTELSRQEIDSFAVFAQNNGVVVNTLGLFSPQADEAEVAQAADELAVLKDKTGGQYQRVENTDAIPAFVISLLSTTLDVLPIELTEPQAVTVDGQAGWQYTFSVTDAYTDDVTLVIPAPPAEITGVVLQAGDGQPTPVESWPGASWVHYTRYNATPGYNVVHLKHLEQQDWTGDYTVTLLTDSQTAPAVSAFFLYDVTVHISLNSDTVGVLQPVQVDVYLTDGNGYRIDDADFLQTLTVELEVVNLQNMGAEVSQQANGSEDRAAFNWLREEMELYNDSFRFKFTPQRASSYQMTAHVSNSRFERHVVTQPLEVQDQLEIESSLLTRQPHKNSPLEVRAYLVQQDNHRKVADEEFYRLCGATATFTNLSTGTAEIVEMEALADGNGLSASFVPTEEGEYEVVVRTNSSRESVERVGETLNFLIVDRPVQLRTFANGSSGLLSSFFKGYHAGKDELYFPADAYFYDPDGDSYRVSCEALSSNGSELVYDNVLRYQPDRAETLEVTLTALDYSGNSASIDLSIRILSVFEVILLTIALILFVLAVLLLAVYLLRARRCARNELRGMLAVDVTLNGKLPELLGLSGRAYHELPLVRCYIPLVNPQNIEDPARLLKPPLTFLTRVMPREVYLGRLLANYAENYRVGGYGVDAVYRYLDGVSDALLTEEKYKKAGCRLRGQAHGALFALKGVSTGVTREGAFLAERDSRLNRLEKCRFVLPVSASLNDRFEESTGLSVCGLQIELSYVPPVRPAKPARRAKKSAPADPETV